MATINDFMELDIRVGEIIQVETFEKAKKPAYQLWVDFGDEIGTKKSSAQITQCYTKEELMGKQVLGVVNFPPRKIADFTSEVLVLGVYAQQGVVLIQPEQLVKKGDKLG
ncbi:tRNA-binding protein [Pelosinus fermentans]|jgi:tRNA-binding protein|uniref:Export-related chaperone CsaA n=1 Tax=Pelosinus fermentans JBW45 TaxID=1192197 RepID=I9NPB3_9FIRM|nr:tRNA-binding protein [Pelosinus fermentans]AJQ28584.1 export-related chaperone CsaA [Pelosinus fermentans JBW45]EIW21833.1 export-related chaperone CsaA [Pelosinus fermentans A11]